MKTAQCRSCRAPIIWAVNNVTKRRRRTLSASATPATTIRNAWRGFTKTQVAKPCAPPSSPPERHSDDRPAADRRRRPAHVRARLEADAMSDTTLAYLLLIAGCLLMAAAMALPFVKQARDRADAWVAWRIEEDDSDE